MHNRRTIVSQAIVIKQGSDKKTVLYSEQKTFSDAMWQTVMKTYFARMYCHSFMA